MLLDGRVGTGTGTTIRLTQQQLEAHLWGAANCICAQPVGELCKELIANLCQARNKRTPRSKGQDLRGRIPDMLSIHVRPPEVEDRQFPGHWEADLIRGEGNASAAHVLQTFTDKLCTIAQPLRKTLTCDQGKEMALVGGCPLGGWHRIVSRARGRGLINHGLRANGYDQSVSATPPERHPFFRPRAPACP